SMYRPPLSLLDLGSHNVRTAQNSIRIPGTNLTARARISTPKLAVRSVARFRFSLSRRNSASRRMDHPPIPSRNLFMPAVAFSQVAVHLRPQDPIAVAARSRHRNHLPGPHRVPLPHAISHLEPHRQAESSRVTPTSFPTS